MKLTLKEHGSLYALHSATATPYKCLLDDARIIIKWRILPACGGGSEREYGAMAVRFLVSRDGHILCPTNHPEYTASCVVIPSDTHRGSQMPAIQRRFVSQRRSGSLAGGGC
ncbi:hypothetical protein BDV09DRAFT_188943 [Aspergillus tetrazonus]